MFESSGFNGGENLCRDVLGYDTVHMVASFSEGFFFTPFIIISINPA
jgi:hypothetical protein